MVNPLINSAIKRLFDGRSALSKLLLINVCIFIFIQLINVCFFLFNVNPNWNEVVSISKPAHWLALPSDIDTLIQRPWTLVTYMFLHENFFHLFFNMIMLYFGGSLFVSFLGSKHLIYTYLLGGIFGGICYVVSFNIFPAFAGIKFFSVALGASASVLAILVAVATYIPKYVIQLFLFGKIKLGYLALILVFLDLLSIDKGNPGGHLAHLGGALWGFTFIAFYKSGLLKPKPKLKIKKTKVKSQKRPLSDDEYNTIKQNNQKKIDAILDTISKKGYDALSKEEKDFLFNFRNK